MNTGCTTQFPSQFADRLVHADCIQWMKRLPDDCVDFGLTDAPYIAHYCDREGRRVLNDDNDTWILPAFTEIFRILRPHRFLVCWYGWHNAETFLRIWRTVGFHVVGHFVAPKPYASSLRFTAAQHEQAYLLAKGTPARPAHPIGDVLPWRYTGNRWHPTQKPLCALRPLVRAFSAPGELIFDPFAGSASTLIAAFQCNRRYCGVELDAHYYALAQQHLAEELSRSRTSAA